MLTWDLPPCAAANMNPFSFPAQLLLPKTIGSLSQFTLRLNQRMAEKVLLFGYASEPASVPGSLR